MHIKFRLLPKSPNCLINKLLYGVYLSQGLVSVVYIMNIFIIFRDDHKGDSKLIIHHQLHISTSENLWIHVMLFIYFNTAFLNKKNIKKENIDKISMYYEHNGKIKLLNIIQSSYCLLFSILTWHYTYWFNIINTLFKY